MPTSGGRAIAVAEVIITVGFEAYTQNSPAVRRITKVTVPAAACSNACHAPRLKTSCTVVSAGSLKDDALARNSVQRGFALCRRQLGGRRAKAGAAP